MVSFDYTRKSDNRTKRYSVEPYEFRNNVFWARHPVHGSIHSFIWPRVSKRSVKQNPSKGYNPRWDLKLDRNPANRPVNRAIREALEAGFHPEAIAEYLIKKKLITGIVISLKKTRKS